jgi:transcriptional regulator with XRE-family HTH domain
MDMKRLTQADLARSVGIKPPSVSDWLNGKTKILKAKTALRAAHFLDVSPLWLTEGRGSMQSSESVLSDVAKNVEPTFDLSLSEKRFVQELLDAMENRTIPTHLKQTIIMLIESAPKKQ